ncbi:AAA family ATPase [Aestuariivirga sp.]|uniref:chromosome segregation SMC family protein n=1 Tax=Aestuariivirga sp. TaxID=2650926 RepID=UPI0025BEB6C6|nr:AAA family ATPase [Aestuariivirga sp.]MCA3554587.1 AAA family ATPase [Aestuariivirga sp.]
MKFTRLRLSGFKSFVEPTELLIEPGLTGVVGPNGCGKSNLLEALRWVMGESSYKSMRASGMDDVIFSGTTERPARNMAEVTVTMLNDDGAAPPHYQDLESLEISRRIERDEGSAYRINGKDARARDVQLLFADASTGSRSPALVRQGQIGEIISAKPQARRLILEEAAGITGLHTRRHEAELKLRAAETNLTRLDDVTAQLETQLNSLKRQARQAMKYKSLSAEIRRLEAMGLYVNWRETAETSQRDAAALDEATRVLAGHTRAASEKLRLRDDLGGKLPGLREQEAVRAAVLQRVSHERNVLDEEERRAGERRKELEQRIAQINSDLQREQELLNDTGRALTRLAGERETLEASQGSDDDIRAGAAVALQSAAEALACAQEAADDAAARLSELSARRNAILRAIEEYKNRVARLDRELAETVARRNALLARYNVEGDGGKLTSAVEHAVGQAAGFESSVSEAEAAVRAARAAEGEARAAHDDARRRADRLQTEVRTLTNLLRAGGGGLWPPLLDQLSVGTGYETALGAALGDDLDASGDEGAPVHWRGLPPLAETAALPDGAEPLIGFVRAPPALQRRLSHIGVVSRALGQALQPQLRPGQRLVSREGDIWRWDGFTAAADAPSAAAKRLAEKNRLALLEVEMEQAIAAAGEARGHFEAARAATETATRVERETREGHRAAVSAVDFARRALTQHERQVSERLAQTSALDEAQRRIREALDEARVRLEGSSAEAAGLPVLDDLQLELNALRNTVNAGRAAYAEARATHDGLEREARARTGRIRDIEAETAQWTARASRASEQIGQLTARAEETRAAIAELSQLPQLLASRRLKLMNMLAEAEADKKAASDALQTAENEVRQADQDLRAVQELLSGAREDHARLGARLEASAGRLAECEQRIAEALNCGPDEVISATGLDPGQLMEWHDIERKLQGLREDRERLGGVNLRADEEAEDVARQLDGLIKERDDLIQAINKLRGGISSLNREGRQRLLDAFQTVNQKFGELFTTLFGGGRAELQLIESDDPLEAGLELIANPPGKKPVTLSLLSGGEQTLTAMALIFAVFLTNPSPICVLDEVDAPLDDHNVERFCNLLDAMLERTETRFLIITHHALTMARMHRLFGVTMLERGVSQLVSVNLAEAETLVDEKSAA